MHCVIQRLPKGQGRLWPGSSWSRAVLPVCIRHSLLNERVEHEAWLQDGVGREV